MFKFLKNLFHLVTNLDEILHAASCTAHMHEDILEGAILLEQLHRDCTNAVGMQNGINVDIAENFTKISTLAQYFIPILDKLKDHAGIGDEDIFNAEEMDVLSARLDMDDALRKILDDAKKED